MTTQTRQPKGRPSGGQFAGTDRPDSDIDLAEPEAPNGIMAAFHAGTYGDTAEGLLDYLDGIEPGDAELDGMDLAEIDEAKRELRDILGIAQPQPGPFTFNRNYDDYEQVRPYFHDYSVRRAELDARGEYPYNDSFTGQIPALAGTDAKNEQTAIYMLQSMHARDQMRRDVEAFRDDGGREIAVADGEIRGDVVVWGWYSGGTGFRVTRDVRVHRDERGRVVVIPKGKRNGFYAESSRNVLVLPKK